MNKQFNSLVTGGVQGIGLSIVKNLIARGDRVFVFDYIAQDDPRVLSLLENKITYIQVDVSSVDSIKQGFQTLFQILDSTNSNLDILVNNAGITRDGLAIRMSEQDWDSVLDVNLKGTFFCCQQAIKKMMRQQKSYIVNISSIVGVNGNSGQANYAASKAGIISLTKSLAQEYGSRDILINAIAPGFIQTEMTLRLQDDVKQAILNRISLKKFGTPEDVANLVVFLTGGSADYITGALIDLNGGLF
jgi:3-oxoacyl-[acyl-carrier protein] reductase